MSQETLSYLLASPTAAAAAMDEARKAAAAKLAISGAVLGVYMKAAGASPSGPVNASGAMLREAAQEAAKEFIFKNISALEKLAPDQSQVLRTFARPAGGVQDWAKGPGVLDLLPQAGDIADGVSNALGDVRKTALVVIGAAAFGLVVWAVVNSPKTPTRAKIKA